MKDSQVNIAKFLATRERGFEAFTNQNSSSAFFLAEDKAATTKLNNKACHLPGNPRSTFLVAFNSDGTKMASTHGNHNIYITDVKTGKCLQTLVGHPRTPWCIAFHPSCNEILASGCLGGEVRVWDLYGGSEVWSTEHHSVVASLAFHPTDQVLVIASCNELFFWNWSQPKPFARCKTASEREKVRFVKFDSLGHYLITGIANLSTMQHADFHPASGVNSRREAFGQTDTARHAALMARYRQVVARYQAHQNQQLERPAALNQRGTTSAANFADTSNSDLFPGACLFLRDPTRNTNREESEPNNDRPPSPGLVNVIQQARAYADFVTNSVRQVSTESSNNSNLFGVQGAGTGGQPPPDLHSQSSSNPSGSSSFSFPQTTSSAFIPSIQSLFNAYNHHSSTPSGSILSSAPDSLEMALDMDYTVPAPSRRPENIASARPDRSHSLSRPRAARVSIHRSATEGSLSSHSREGYSRSSQSLWDCLPVLDPNCPTIRSTSSLSIPPSRYVNLRIPETSGPILPPPPPLSPPPAPFIRSESPPLSINSNNAEGQEGQVRLHNVPVISVSFSPGPSLAGTTTVEEPARLPTGDTSQAADLTEGRRLPPSLLRALAGLQQSLEGLTHTSEALQRNDAEHARLRERIMNILIRLENLYRNITPLRHAASDFLQDVHNRRGRFQEHGATPVTPPTNSSGSWSGASTEPPLSSLEHGSRATNDLRLELAVLRQQLARYMERLFAIEWEHVRTDRQIIQEDRNWFQQQQLSGAHFRVQSCPPPHSSGRTPPVPRHSEVPVPQNSRINLIDHEDRDSVSPSTENNPYPLVQVEIVGERPPPPPPYNHFASYYYSFEPPPMLRSMYLYPNYTYTLGDDNRSSDALQAAINRAIAGAFMGTGESAVANNIMNLTHRIQCWNFKKFEIPDISDAQSNLLVPQCKIHNDASCDISANGRYLATFVPSHGGFPSDTVMAIYSLEPTSFGLCLYTKNFGPNAISVSLSPLGQYVLVGLASRRLTLQMSSKQIVGQIFKLHQEFAGEESLLHVQDIEHEVEPEQRISVSINSAHWLPIPGQGIVYCTNRGNLRICRPGLQKEEDLTNNSFRSSSREPNLTSAPSSSSSSTSSSRSPPASHPTAAFYIRDLEASRSHLMQMFGVVPRATNSTSTQTIQPSTQSAGTQTENLNAEQGTTSNTSNTS